MRKFILLVSAATMANVIALLLLFGQPSTATNHATVPGDPDGVSSIPHLPLTVTHQELCIGLRALS